MIIKLKNLLTFWVLFTVILIMICVYTAFQVDALSGDLDVDECLIEVEMANISTNMSVVEKEKEIIVEKVVHKYEFPFETVDKGTMIVKGICKDCSPQKEYSRMRSKNGITVFASKDVLPEGTLIWIDTVGIRQVQSLVGGYDGIYVYYDTHAEAEKLGVQELRVFEVIE